MTRLRRSLSILSVFLIIAGFSAGTASADSSHARIVRVSYVQGDVRFARDVKGDPLSDSRGNWENAVLNLPIRQGYALATDNGRAEVEFEDGARAFDGVDEWKEHAAGEGAIAFVEGGRTGVGHRRTGSRD
jgi:hypothetical protein